MLHRRILAALVIAGAAPLAAQTADKPALQPPITLTAADSARFLALGKTYTRWFLSGKADSLATAIEPKSLEGLGGIDGIVQAQANVAERAGAETKVVEEKLTRRNGRLQFWHAGEFTGIPGDAFVIRWVLDEQGRIVGAGLGPKANTPPVD